VEARIAVRWELAEDEAMQRLVQHGTLEATPQWGYSLHVEVKGLQPQRHYFYRFMAGDAVSPVGRTRTLPPLAANNFDLRFAYASCQHYEQGYFSAYRHMVADNPDFIIHMGDYIYESSWGKAHVRKHNTPEPVTLDEYRARHALYKGDADLQSAHKACAWMVIWDDHEVQNDYANDRSQHDGPRDAFLLRRAAAYQAYYEHMPLPASMRPRGPAMPIHARIEIGQLAQLYLLDGRQYRSHQACPPPKKGGGNSVDESCSERLDQKLSYLGMAQEQWLYDNLQSRQSQWNILAQPTLVAQCDRLIGAGQKFSTDAWSGYPAARQRLIDNFERAKTRNNVVLGGDVHTFYVSALKKDFDRPDSATVAAEFVGSSVTAQSWAQSRTDAVVRENPHMLFGNSETRGYMRVQMNGQRLLADLCGLDNVADAETACTTLARYMVEKGNPNPQKA
jgi:alkaline phosphatase D